MQPSLLIFALFRRLQ